MSRVTTAEHGAHLSKGILLVGSAVLSALFTHIATSALWSSVHNFGGAVPYRYVIGPLVIAIVLGAGLRWLARRYRTPIIQAAALVGAGVMTVLLIAAAWLQFSENSFIFTILAVLPLFPVARITANPLPEPGELTGAALLWRSLPGVSRRGVENKSSQRSPSRGQYALRVVMELSQRYTLAVLIAGVIIGIISIMVLIQIFKMIGFLVSFVSLDGQLLNIPIILYRYLTIIFNNLVIVYDKQPVGVSITLLVILLLGTYISLNFEWHGPRPRPRPFYKIIIFGFYLAIIIIFLIPIAYVTSILAPFVGINITFLTSMRWLFLIILTLSNFVIYIDLIFETLPSEV